MPLDWCGFIIVSASPSPISIAKHLLMPLQNNLVIRGKVDSQAFSVWLQGMHVGDTLQYCDS